MKRILCVISAAMFVVNGAYANAPTNSDAKATQSQTRHHQVIAFWQWFKQHQPQLSEMQDPSAPIFPELGRQIKQIDQALAFEIGPASAGNKELAISADCNESLFPLVKEIVVAAPPLAGWKVVAFRQRTPPAYLSKLAISAKLALDGQVIQGQPSTVQVAVANMRGLLKKNGHKANLIILMKDYQDLEPQRAMAVLMLQQAVGEYDYVEKIGDIEFKNESAANSKTSIPFEQIGPALDKLAL